MRCAKRSWMVYVQSGTGASVNKSGMALGQQVPGECRQLTPKPSPGGLRNMGGDMGEVT